MQNCPVWSVYLGGANCHSVSGSSRKMRKFTVVNTQKHCVLMSSIYQV